MLKIWGKHIAQHYRDTVLLGIAGAVIGVLTGAAAAVFGLVLLACTEFREEHFWWVIPFLPAAGAVICLLYERFGKNAGRGMRLVFAVGFGEAGGLPFRMAPLAMAGTWLTHLFGGSAGREGVAVQIGAAVADNIGRLANRLVRTGESRKVFLITGMAAGFAGLFRTPLAAVFFALEVLVVGRLEYHALFPASIAALTASFTSGAMGLEKFQIDMSAFGAETGGCGPAFFLKLAGLGLLFGLAGSLFAVALRIVRLKLMFAFSSQLKKTVVMGCVLAVFTALCWQGRYSGTGTNLIGLCFGEGGGQVMAWDWLLKLAFTVLTLSAGFMGGEVAPLFSIGACLGFAAAPLFGFSPVFGAALGFAAVFGSGSNTLLASILVGAEIFGYSMLPYFAVTCIMAYIFNFNKSIFTAQKSAGQ